MRNLIIFLSLTFFIIGAKRADAQSNNSDWHVPPPLTPNNSDWKVPPPIPSKYDLGFRVIRLPKLLAVLPPIPPVEPLSIPADLTRETGLEGENSSRTGHRQDNPQPKPIVRPCCCCCCCPPVGVRKPAKLRPKGKILSSSHIRKVKPVPHKPLKPKVSVNAALKPKVVKHRPVKHRSVRYIRYCPCSVDTSSSVNNQPKANGEKP
ncbi:hypothetical protein Mucpa_3450 [Mucilaginibacter paludis DSM 18603]|uniref:Uncharacterized protein n=1 Tax=Mucilaginibacter paludis DSM 18603 TaxID=714943 RepID=H1YID6_9SPHI|nr:hypothetical protein Mucpa_3450 [Mucilaginibacter paludis DSM 18603]